MQGTGYGDAWTLTYSPGCKIWEVLPSIETPAGDLLRSPIRSVINDDDGKTSGRNDKLRGQIGVKTSALSEGWTMGPPAESEYAVDPVGVDTISPSETASVRCWPSTKMSMVFKWGLEPL